MLELILVFTTWNIMSSRTFCFSLSSQEALMLNSAKQYKRNKDKEQEARMIEKARVINGACC